MNNTFPHAHRFGELDGLRGIAALGVVVYHFGMACTLAWPILLGPIYERGLFLVDLFFALSGFVLAHAFDQPHRRDQFAKNVGARILRLYPLHLITLVATGGLWLAYGDALAEHNAFHSVNDGYHFALSLGLLQASGLEHGYSFNTPSWSISTELLVNSAWFASLLLPRRIGLTAMALVTTACAVVLQRHGLVTGARLGGVINLSLLRTALGFLAGYWAYRCYQRMPRRADGSLYADAVTIMLLVCTACWFARWGIFDRHARTVMVLWSLVVFPSLLVALLHSRWIRRAMMCKPFMRLGGISFALYLTHVPVFYMLVLVIPKEALDANEGLGIFVVTSLFVATVAANFFERPVRRWLDGLLKDNSKTWNQTGTHPSSMLPEAK